MHGDAWDTVIIPRLKVLHCRFPSPTPTNAAVFPCLGWEKEWFLTFLNDSCCRTSPPLSTASAGTTVSAWHSYWRMMTSGTQSRYQDAASWRHPATPGKARDWSDWLTKAGARSKPQTPCE
jgi:hypothetical protein